MSTHRPFLPPTLPYLCRKKLCRNVVLIHRTRPIHGLFDVSPSTSAHILFQYIIAVCRVPRRLSAPALECGNHAAIVGRRCHATAPISPILTILLPEADTQEPTVCMWSVLTRAGAGQCASATDTARIPGFGSQPSAFSSQLIGA